MQRSVLAISIVFSLYAISPSSVDAAPQPSKNLPDIVLDQCEAATEPFDRYDPVVNGAVKTLIGLGALKEGDFRNVKIGFCGLRALDGPVATTSCSKDTILLDHKYLSAKEALSLNATLAHEMKHVFQHRLKKNQFGSGYCSSTHYVNDTAQLEEEADLFGDQIASFLFIGRPIEIKNTCASAVSVYLETDTPAPTPSEGETFMTIAPGTTKALSTKSKSKFVHLYGQSVPYDGRQWFWRSNNRDLRRSVETKTIRMRPVTMTTKARAEGSFMIELICP